MRYAVKLDRPATLEDLERLPATWRGEIIDGALYAFARPWAPHANAKGGIATDLYGPFVRGRGGAGGSRRRRSDLECASAGGERARQLSNNPSPARPRASSPANASR